MRKHGRNRISPADASRPIIGDHIVRLRNCLRQLPTDQVAEVAERLWDVARSGGQIIIAGNGGSAATASHMALDLGKSSLGRDPRRAALRIRTVALNDPGPVVTAWANDYGYDRVFAEQITTLARPGDAAVFCSVSGNSPNVVAAARAARSIGTLVIALLGRPGGAMRGLADLAVVVPSEDYQIVEEVHLSISHMVTRYLVKEIDSAAASCTGHGGQRRHVAPSAHPPAIQKRQTANAREHAK